MTTRRIAAVSCALAAAAGVAGSAAGAAAAPLSALYADASQPDISGLWVVTGAFYFSPDRALPKLKGEYKTLYARRTEAFKAGIAVDDVTADCLPAGLPHLFVVPYPFELMQTPGRVTFLHEYDSVVRRVPLTGAASLKVDEDRVTYDGDSAGHWEGDTLVIDTVNVRADTQLDFTGTPHSDQLHITERLRRKDATTLENRITLTDPKAYEEPFTVTREYRLRPKWKISEYVCEENNRNATDAAGHTTGGMPPPKKEAP